MVDRPLAFFEGTEMPTAGWWEALWPNPAAIVAAVGIERGMDIVDLCSGDGWFTLQIAKIAHRVVAIDIDQNLLEVARNRLAENGVTNAEFIESDACEIAKFKLHPVDFIFMANAFHGVPDQTRLVRAVSDTLKPGGKFAVVNWHSRPREETAVLGEPRGPRTELRISPDHTRAAVEADGLECIRFVEVPPYHYAITFQRPLD